MKLHSFARKPAPKFPAPCISAYVIDDPFKGYLSNGTSEH